MSDDSLTREFLAERDLLIMQMKRAGSSETDIARRFRIGVGAVRAALSRQLTALNQQAMLAYPEVLRLELERLDALQRAAWPMTQPRQITTDDGSTIVLEPDLKAIQQVLSIMDRRAKLLGLEQASKIDVQVSGAGAAVAPELAGNEHGQSVDDYNPKAEAMTLARLMLQSGAISNGELSRMLELEAPVDAVIVEEDEPDE